MTLRIGGVWFEGAVLVLADLATVCLLGASWWVSLRVLGGIQGASAARLDKLIKRWPGHPLDSNVMDALAACDLPVLEVAYSELKAHPGTLAEAVVSLALAEATGDTVKAQRGLEAVRLMLNNPDVTMAERRSGVLDGLESRLRLVLADAGYDPRQRELAQAALERKSSAGGPSAG